MAVHGKYFMIVSEATGFVLDVKGGSSRPGTEVIMWEKSGANNQVWYKNQLTGTIRSKATDLCLSINSSDCLVVDKYKKDDQNQQWRYNQKSKTVDNRANPQKVLDVYGASTTQGAKICIYDFHGNPNQLWKIEPIEMNGKVLDIEGCKKEAGGRVIMYDQKDPKDADNQLWFEDLDGNIRSKLNPRLVLDAKGSCLRTAELDGGDLKLCWCIDGKKIVNCHDQKEVVDIKEAKSCNCAELCGYGYKGSPNQH